MLGCSVTHPSTGIKPLLRVLSGDRKHTNGLNGKIIRVKVESFSGPLWPAGSLHLVVNKYCGTLSAVQRDLAGSRICLKCAHTTCLIVFLECARWQLNFSLMLHLCQIFCEYTTVHPSMHPLSKPTYPVQGRGGLEPACSDDFFSNTSAPDCDWLGCLSLLGKPTPPRHCDVVLGLITAKGTYDVIDQSIPCWAESDRPWRRIKFSIKCCRKPC